MAANLLCEKNSLAVLSNKRTKAFSKSRADEAFALPSFVDASPTFSVESSYRSVREPKVELRVNNVEILKQTMLQHESMFKEQLYELHRLYQVQRMLMEESKKRSVTSHPHSDSPPSNSSVPHYPNSCRAKEERRFWEASNASRPTSIKQLSFLSGQIDVNKPCEDKHLVEHSQRPLIDLEQPADEVTAFEVEDEKPLLRNSFFQPVEKLLPPRASWQDSQCTSLSGIVSSMAMHEEKTNSMCREMTPNSVKWRIFEDCFTPERKEVPFFPPGSSNSKCCSTEGSSLPLSHSNPVTSLFGVNLMRETNNRDVQRPAIQSNLEYNRREPKIPGSDACDKSTGQASKLPHWLLQGLQTSSVTNVSPLNSAHDRQQETSHFLQKQEEGTLSYEQRVSFMCARQERSELWVKAGSGHPSGENFLSAPHCKSSPGYLSDPVTGNAHQLRKLAQSSGVKDGISSLSPSSAERRIGASLTPATTHSSSPFVPKQSLSSERDAALPFFLKEPTSNLNNSGSFVPPWYQQEAPPSVIPLASPVGGHKQRPTIATRNTLNSWVNVPAVQEDAFLKRTQGIDEIKTQGISGFHHSVVTRPEVSSRRLIFGFMPTAADLDLTLGLDLNDDEAREGMQRVDDSLSNGHLAQRHIKVGLRSEPVRYEFDLNEQSGQVMDAESQMIPTTSKHQFEGCTGWGCGLSAGVKSDSSGLKAIPEETTASTGTLRPQSVACFLQTGRHGDAPEDERLHGIRGSGGLVGGRSSDGSGLTSCESRSTPVPVWAKGRDGATLSGEACQRVAVGQSSQEVIFDGASVVSGRRKGLFSAMLGCLEAYQGDTAGNVPTDKFTFKNSYAPAGNDKASNGIVDASEAADTLVLLSLDPPSMVIEKQYVDGDGERALKWLAESIPQDDMLHMDGDLAVVRLKQSLVRGSEHHVESIGIGEKVLDAFELAVLSLKPINPDSETTRTIPIVRCDVAEECLPPSHLRRRSLRRGKSGKDFQKEMLPTIASLSRQEITEDLQIIEGLVKSTTEALARCSLSSKEDVSWSLPALSSTKTPCKAKGFRTCKAGKHNGLLRVCSWGESTRRRRMRRQRRVFLPLGY
ncbi:hypothetical protein L7F22_034798 [Adiantum nelumboides]|nr:hypothetical protein [Adiantum nelumboides]